MAQKDIFRILIKLFGLYLGFNALVMLPEVIIPLFFDYMDSTYFTASIISLLVVLSLLYVFIFKTDSIIHLFKLDNGFDSDKVDLQQFNSEGVIKLGLIILSLYFIITSIPDIITNLYYAFKISIPQNALENVLEFVLPTQPDYYILTSGIFKLLIGAILIMNKNRIATRIEKLN